mmetsp:Transcript_33085/g.99980  ORF Transcript_33085/g.99980 Transcript_33085/m.99980 type:complete len:266 (-) Transcript_33085:402-1199(-)
MVPEQRAVRAVDQEHFGRLRRQLLCQMEGVALLVDHDAAPQGLRVLVLLGRPRLSDERAEEGVGVTEGLLFGKHQAQVNFSAGRRLFGQHPDEAPGEPPAQPLELRVRGEARVELPEVANERAHSKGEKDQVLRAQGRASGAHVREDMLHRLEIAFLVQLRVGVAPRARRDRKVWEVGRLRRFADVQRGRVRHPEVPLVAFDPIPIAVQVGRDLRGDHVVPAEQEGPTRGRKAQLGSRRAVQEHVDAVPHRFSGVPSGVAEVPQP